MNNTTTTTTTATAAKNNYRYNQVNLVKALSAEIFDFTTDELARTTQLQRLIKGLIDESPANSVSPANTASPDNTANTASPANTNKTITFSQFMHLALYEPTFGYYANHSATQIGMTGDFVTAPTVSKLFAKTLAKQIKELIVYSPSRQILEIGAGNGQLLLDLLSEVGDIIDCYYIVELSSSLANIQKERLIKSDNLNYISKVQWLSAIPDAFDGIILANELLDAMPCDIVVWDNSSLLARNVCWDKTKNRLSFCNQELPPNLHQIGSTIVPAHGVRPYISEISLANRSFIKDIAESLNCGFVILIDYGYGAGEYYAEGRSHGTLRGFLKQHLVEDVLLYPGLVDITVSVDFSAIATTAIECGLDLIGYTTQANFLLNCGITDLINQSDNPGNPLDIKESDYDYLYKTNQINYLTSPNEMGDIFKVIGFSKNIEFSDWLGFRHGDKSYML